MLQIIKTILALPKELADLAECINCKADEVQESLKLKGVELDILKDNAKRKLSYARLNPMDRALH